MVFMPVTCWRRRILLRENAGRVMCPKGITEEHPFCTAVAWLLCGCCAKKSRCYFETLDTSTVRRGEGLASWNLHDVTTFVLGAVKLEQEYQHLFEYHGVIGARLVQHSGNYDAFLQRVGVEESHHRRVIMERLEELHQMPDGQWKALSAVVYKHDKQYMIWDPVGRLQHYLPRRADVLQGLPRIRWQNCACSAFLFVYRAPCFESHDGRNDRYWECCATK